MKTFFCNIFKFLFITILFCSCELLQYVPNSQNVPLLEEKGEIVGSLALSMGERFAGFEVQSAYSFTEHIGLQLNGMVWGGIDYSQGVLFDIAPGYFLNVAENVVFEVYGGYGRGKIYHTYNYDSQSNISFVDVNLDFVNYDRYFIQPAIGYHVKNFDFAFSTRFNLMDYYGTKPIYAFSSDDPWSFTVQELDKFYTIDPAITMRFGWRQFKFQLQSVFLIPILNEHRVFTDQYQAFYEKLGFTVFHGDVQTTNSHGQGRESSWKQNTPMSVTRSSMQSLIRFPGI